MLSFKPKCNYLIHDIIIADVTLEKIRVGSIKVPGLNPKQFMGMSLSFIGQAVADHYGQQLKDYSEDAPSWMSVIYDVNAIPYVSIQNAERAAGWHDYVLAEGEITSDLRIGCAEKVGRTVLKGRPVHVVTEFSEINGPAIASAINHACNVIPGFEPSVSSLRVFLASTLVEALEALNERDYVGIVLMNPSNEDRRMMKAARVRHVLVSNHLGEMIAIIGYNTIPHPFMKRDLQVIEKLFNLNEL